MAVADAMAPNLSIVPHEDQIAAGAADGQFGKERPAFIRQRNVARFARLALAHGYCSGLGVQESTKVRVIPLSRRSIPLGRAKEINKLRYKTRRLSKIWPIYQHGFI